MSKALKNGDLDEYESLQKQIKRFPRGTLNPSASPKLQHSEGDFPDGNITVLDPEENLKNLENMDSIKEIDDQEIQNEIKEHL